MQDKRPGRFLLPLCVVLLSSCAAQSPLPLPCNQTAATSLKVYFDPVGTPVVLVGLGTTAAAMLVDTGAQNTVITHEIAVQAGLSMKTFDETLKVGGVGGETPAYVTTAPQLTLGNTVGNDVKIIALAKSAAPGIFGTKTAIDGMLANDIWRNYDLDLDFRNQQMTLYSQASCATLPFSWTGKIAAIPITIDYYGYVYVPVQIDGHKFSAMLDSGTTESTVSRELMRSAGFPKSAGVELRRVAILAVGGALPGALVRFHEMVVGTEKIENPIILVTPFDYNMPYSSAFLRYNSASNMILGEDFIRTHHLYISYSTQTLYIQD